MDELKPPYDVATSGSAIIRIANSIEIPPYTTIEAPLNFGRAFSNDELFQKWRGHIINNSLFVEEKIEQIISLIFTKSDEREPFHSIILSKEFFTFMNKLKILKDILDTKSPYNERNYKQLKADLHEIVNIRNKFAHGRVTYFGNNADKMILEYFSGELKKDEITENTVKNFIELVKKCHDELNNIILEIQEKSKK